MNETNGVNQELVLNNKRRVWTRDELAIPYYMATIGLEHLGVPIENILKDFLPGATKNSLDMGVANFRAILGIKGHKLSGYSKIQEEVARELDNMGSDRVEDIIFSLISVKQYKEIKFEDENLTPAHGDESFEDLIEPFTKKELLGHIWATNIDNGVLLGRIISLLETKAI